MIITDTLSWLETFLISGRPSIRLQLIFCLDVNSVATPLWDSLLPPIHIPFLCSEPTQTQPPLCGLASLWATTAAPNFFAHLERTLDQRPPETSQLHPSALSWL